VGRSTPALFSAFRSEPSVRGQMSKQELPV
jgi:hypothetical protein